VSKSVLIVGDGVLAESVCKLLALYKSCDVIHERKWIHVEETLHGAKLAVVLDDCWLPANHKRAEDMFQEAGIPWLRGFVVFGIGMIGPHVKPGVPGCSKCADMRRMMAEQERNQMFHIWSTLEECQELTADAWASRSGLLHMAYLLVVEIERALANAGGSSLDCHLMWVNLKSLKTSRHFFLPDPDCPVCSREEHDSPANAQILLEPSPKINIDSFRCKQLDNFGQILEQEYLDNRTGILNAKVRDLITPFAAVSVNLPLLIGDEGSGGRSHSYSESSFTAILEGLERYCGIEPRGKKPNVYDTYANLKHQAINPAKVGLHAPEQYAQPGFPFRQYTDDLPLDWVWGYSLAEKRSVLVPKLLAYYSMGYQSGFVYETSNGCAVGSNIVEAIFHGILEIVERDAFLMTWFAKLPLQRIDVSTIDDLEFKWMVDRLHSVSGYDLHLFCATMENQIPSVFAIAKNRRKSGVNLICAGGAHLDPLRAVKGAVHELAGMLHRFDEKLETGRAHYLQMYHDSSRVSHMEDHSMLYGLTEAEERLSFLLNQHLQQSFTEAFRIKKKHADLTDELDDLLSVFKGLGMDVIVVNQTSPELKKNGLCCVKVLIPGMLPMTFGHHLTRLTGLDRVFRIPAELGYTSRPLTQADLNPYPHPFP
jgi:ribosomal protein S12 methylthiotransferase accessory factor